MPDTTPVAPGPTDQTGPFGMGLGVVRKDSTRWKAQISNAGVKIHLGLFDTPEAAAWAYDIAAQKLHGVFAARNYPMH